MDYLYMRKGCTGETNQGRIDNHSGGKITQRDEVPETKGKGRTVMALEILWSLNILVVVFSVDAAHSQQGSRGLSCVNDVINNVTCTWNGSPAAPGVNCSISGVKKTRIKMNKKRVDSQMIRTCSLDHLSSPPGCSFVFENEELNCLKDMPYIRMECDGKLVDNLTNYKPCDHIKMHPPGVPNVSTTANDTWISWTAGSPRSSFIKFFKFQLQVKQKKQTWKEAHNLFMQEVKEKILSSKLKGYCQARVRVIPTQFPNSHWSNWSPTASWVVATDEVAPSQNQEWLLGQTSLLMVGVIFSFGLILTLMLVLNRSCLSKGFHKQMPVPNPSKYFHTLHSVHGGNLKTWLNPLSAAESFFTAEPRDHISRVELCEGSDGHPSTSFSSTGNLLHFNSCPSAGSDTSGVDNSSFSSSSFFSNMGYFLSSSSTSSARTDPYPAYFTYQEDFHNLHKGHNLHLSLCPSITPTPNYESLKREPQSPDSGFGIGKEDEEDKEDRLVVDEETEEVLDDHQTSPLLTLPLHLPSQMCPPSSPLPSANAPSLTQVSSDSQQVDTPVAAAGGSYAGWPVVGAMCRSSSMPVEPCKTGYLTLKELQTTFSNKSI
uniref:interleukin-2 receptor subunit beta isoform X2 n=2 Tax=Scatophagus argus TaxID=75038 RepID=UPI001ED850EF|nr:interleukin-2 receptor subunit beta isoform X2 [Scatophagus argus]